eukprot:m51a1_g12494 hypothetical protein (165) ;mRNA; f:3829-4411
MAAQARLFWQHLERRMLDDLNLSEDYVRTRSISCAAAHLPDRRRCPPPLPTSLSQLQMHQQQPFRPQTASSRNLGLRASSYHCEAPDRACEQRAPAPAARVVVRASFVVEPCDDDAEIETVDTKDVAAQAPSVSSGGNSASAAGNAPAGSPRPRCALSPSPPGR